MPVEPFREERKRTTSIDDLSRPKVSDLDAVVIVEEQVLGLQITMNECS